MSVGFERPLLCMIMAPRGLVFCDYSARFWDGAVKVLKDEIKVGDLLILGGCRRPGWRSGVVEVRVMSLNCDKTVTAIVRGGGVENVKIGNLRRPDWFSKPRSWRSLGPRGYHRYQRPLFKDDMLKHGVAIEHEQAWI